MSSTETLDNILNKSNCKNFGLNYAPLVELAAKRFALESNDVLVIGYDVAHPGQASAQEKRILRAKRVDAESLTPSVVGVSTFRRVCIKRWFWY